VSIGGMLIMCLVQSCFTYIASSVPAAVAIGK
jgi:hypothetical protein